MSEFNRLLRSMSGEQVRRCAGELAEALGGGTGQSYRVSASPSERTTRGRARPAEDESEAPIPYEAPAESGDEREEGKKEPQSAERAELEKKLRELSESKLTSLGGETAENTGEAAEGGRTAFSGPERRYENEVGARSAEMNRVSDFFKRDSRRYDAGFKRY